MHIHYDDIWDKQQAIADFVGFPIPLPTRRERQKKVLDEPIYDALFDELRGLMHELRARTR